MKYLLDVNVLIAWGNEAHEFHDRVERWLTMLDPKKDEIAGCSITELGFVRIISQTPQLGMNVEETRDWLVRLKKSSRIPFVFFNDDNDIEKLPGWVKNPKQITDGHLLQLAKSRHAELATLDRKITGAFVIPH